jgi:type IV pilus assembly PilN-like protein
MHLPMLHRSLAAQGFALVRLVQWSLAAVVTGSVVVAGWLWWDSRALDEQAVQYEAAATRIQEANRQFAQESLQAGFDLSETRRRALAQEVSFSKRVAEQHAFSWTQFLSALEETVPARVSLNSVALAPKEAVISLNGSALALADVTAFVNALENHRAFRNVVLAQHRVQERAKDGDHQTRSRPTIEFTLTVTYRPPAASPASPPLEGEDKR